MRKGVMVPPDHCVVIEVENETYLGYRAALLLSEIEKYGSLTHSAQWAGIETGHARELLLEINIRFSQPLVCFAGDSFESDRVTLTKEGGAVVQNYWDLYIAALPPLEERQGRNC